METDVFTILEPEVLALPSIRTQTGTIKAGMSTRRGGYSSPPYESLNFGYHVSDDPQMVTKNRRRLGDIIGIPPERWIAGEQVHGHQVALVTSNDAGKGALDYHSVIKGVDGLLTADKDVLLTACYADCTPLYFWSKEHPAVGLAHAGWKGTVGEIAAVMIDRFQNDIGIQPNQLSVAIGPSIGPCCYEVDNHVGDKVKQISGVDHTNVMTLKENGHFMLNLQLLNKLILLKNGILEDNIFTTTRCTSCHTDTFFSHRKEGGPTGRMISYIGIFGD